MASSQQTLHPEFRDPANWNFENLTGEEDIHACLYWEYARQSEFMREIEVHWEEECIQSMSPQERHRLFPFCKSSIFPFPGTPWRKLDLQTKASVIKYVRPIQVFIHPVLETLEAEIERVKRESRNRRSQYLFIEITPDTWKFNTNDAIRNFLHDQVPILRPRDIPNPGPHGRRYSDMKIALRRLGAMRLLALYPFDKAVRLAEENFPERDWQNRETWSSIRTCCKKKLRALFLFLPPGEEKESFAV